jgi:hypothetical protein
MDGISTYMPLLRAALVKCTDVKAGVINRVLDLSGLIVSGGYHA